MENVLLNINTELTKGEYFAYFLPEYLYVLGIILNLILYVFRKRKDSTNRYSDFLTSVILGVNSIVLFFLGVKSYILIDDVNFSFIKNIFYYNNDLMLIKAFLSLFGLSYLFAMYKITRKTRIKTALLNSILLCITNSLSMVYCTEALVPTSVLITSYNDS